MPHKIYVTASNGAQKNRPKDKYYFFEIKYSKTLLTIDMTATLYFEIYSLLSHLPFSSSFVSVLVFFEIICLNFI